MKKCEFSEKFYEILFDHLLLNNMSGVHLYIPSQNKEAKLGYDALFKDNKRKRVLAFQFKVCEEYIKIPKYFSKNRVFKFELHKEKKGNYIQHNKLVNYNLNGKYRAFYVVPYFNSYKDLYDFLNKNMLLQNSLFLLPEIYIKDKNSHFINFDKNIGFQHSKEKHEIKVFNYDEFAKYANELVPIDQAEFEEIVSESSNKNIYLLFDYFK